MKIKWFLLPILFVAILIFSAFHSARTTSKQTLMFQQKNRITVYLAGDSTVANYPKTWEPKAGWGQMIAAMFDEHVIVKNVAVPGRSSKSFIKEGRLSRILNQIHKGDYLLIQFGHNDEKIEDPTRYTDPTTTYKSYLKQYIDGSRKRGAIPVLVTPVERRQFSRDNQALATHGQYPDAMREVGREEKVAVIDLNKKSRELFQQQGPVKTKELFLFLDAGVNHNFLRGVKDNTHFQEKGAYMMARLVVMEIKAQKLPLQMYISNKRSCHMECVSKWKNQKKFMQGQVACY
ncbi:rhamnogalacturonan acetylesterase [Neobacillus pocheonensis]|uniref:rhamnogalacturonan acetylesterase n=1 Tax=Neobacillus pocheonensis TaxID=363869 RepID=UPI003D2AC1AB